MPRNDSTNDENQGADEVQVAVTILMVIIRALDNDSSNNDDDDNHDNRNTGIRLKLGY